MCSSLIRIAKIHAESSFINAVAVYTLYTTRLSLLFFHINKETLKLRKTIFINQIIVYGALNGSEYVKVFVYSFPFIERFSGK